MTAVPAVKTAPPGTEELPTSFIEKPHEMSSIRKVIGVVSGKGGVGKSMVTSMLAVLANRRGYNSAVLDADVTGPSIPKAFGIHERATGGEWGMFPARSKMGIEVMSVNMLLENETDPVIWRGPIIAGCGKAVLDHCDLERCGLHVRGYAPRNR